MALPTGVLTATVTFGPFLTEEGEIFVGKVTVTSNGPRTWAATGVPVMPSEIELPLNDQGTVSIVLPATDQEGWTDGVGAQLINWTYTASVVLEGGPTYTRSFQLPTLGEDDVEVDFDLLSPVPQSGGVYVDATSFVQKLVDDAIADNPGGGTISSADITDATTVGKAVLTAANQSAARTAIGAGSSNLVVGSGANDAKAGNWKPVILDITDSTVTGRTILGAPDVDAVRTYLNILQPGTTAGTIKPGDWKPAAADITDSTATGRSVLTAADASAARGAIGAGTSSLTIGTSGSQAKAGNWFPASTDITDATTIGEQLLQASTAEAARLVIGAGTGSSGGLTLGLTSTQAKPGDWKPVIEDITDAGSVGKTMLFASTQSAGRTAIGAGTSNLAIGTTSTTAKAGDYQPTAENISNATTLGRTILKAADAAAVRTAIGAGTSNLAVGSTSGEAKAGNWTPGIADLPAGVILKAEKPSGGSWPARPTTRTDITVHWIGATPGPSVVTSPSTGGAYNGDIIDLTA